MLDVLSQGYWKVLRIRGKVDLSRSASTISLTGLYCIWCSHTSACTEASAEALGELHGEAYAGSSPVAYGHSMITCLPYM